MNRNKHIRIQLAVLQLVLVCAMLANDWVFIHKHQTAQGIVIHTHPYDLTNNPGDNRHHHTAHEIFLLDMVFQDLYLRPLFTTVGLKLILILEIARFTASSDPFIRDVNGLANLRAPPIWLLPQLTN